MTENFATWNTISSPPEAPTAVIQRKTKDSIHRDAKLTKVSTCNDGRIDARDPMVEQLVGTGPKDPTSNDTIDI